MFTPFGEYRFSKEILNDLYYFVDLQSFSPYVLRDISLVLAQKTLIFSGIADTEQWGVKGLMSRLNVINQYHRFQTISEYVFGEVIRT